MVTQLCFRSWEEFCQGTTRISKSQRSFCRERRRGESGSQARLPAVAPLSPRRSTLRQKQSLGQTDSESNGQD